jgi:hypothetical protein
MKQYKQIPTNSIDEAGMNALAREGWRLWAIYPLSIAFNRPADHWAIASMLVFERDLPDEHHVEQQPDESQEPQEPQQPPRKRRSRPRKTTT